MKKFLFLLFIAGIYSNAFCQNDNDKIKTVINTFFQGLKNSDSSMVKQTIVKDAVLMTSYMRKEIPTLGKENLQDLLKAVAEPKKPGEEYDERLLSWDIKVDDRMANVWTPYAFFIGEKFSHCGVNNFQLYKSEDGWKILSIFDTRRRDNCPQ